MGKCFKTVSGIMLVLMVVFVCRYVDTRSPIMRHIGQRSMFVYVIHVSILDIMTHIDSVSSISKAIIMLMSTVVLVEGIWYIYHKLEGLITNHV